MVNIYRLLFTYFKKYGIIVYGVLFMMWSKLQKQLYLIIDKDSKFQMHCSVYKTKSAWTAGQKNGISKGREMIPRYWITVGTDKDVIWDFPNKFLDEPSQIKNCYWNTDEVSNTINNTYFWGDNYTWVAETIRFYLDTPKDKLLTQKYHKDKYGLTEILRKYDRRINKNVRNLL